MNALNFIPLLISTFSLAYASFTGNKKWAVVAFVVWLVIFALTFWIK